MAALTLYILFHLPSALFPSRLPGPHRTHFDDLINGHQFMAQADSFNGRVESSRGCWLFGGICIKLDDCSNHLYYVSAPDCNTDQNVCCMSSNFRELKNYANIGLKNSLPWKKVRLNASRRPTAAEMETHLINKKYYLIMFNIDIDRTKIGDRALLDTEKDFEYIGSNETEEYYD